MQMGPEDLEDDINYGESQILKSIDQLLFQKISQNTPLVDIKAINLVIEFMKNMALHTILSIY